MHQDHPTTLLSPYNPPIHTKIVLQIPIVFCGFSHFGLVQPINSNIMRHWLASVFLLSLNIMDGGFNQEHLQTSDTSTSPMSVSSQSLSSSTSWFPTRGFSEEPWILHDTSSPVFLRLFDETLSWVEAEEVCQRHFGHLVRDGNGNEAFVHDFLSSLDISNEIWIGLYQNSPFERFQWSDDLTSSFAAPPPNFVDERTPIPPSSNVWPDFNEDSDLGMCVSVNPSSGYRWNTRFCNGPDKAVFVCQVPVPKWIDESECRFNNMPSILQPESPSSSVGASSGGVGSDPSNLLHPVFQDISYFPHNDSVQVRFQCRSKNARTNGTIQLKTCSFEETSTSFKRKANEVNVPSSPHSQLHAKQSSSASARGSAAISSMLCSNEANAKLSQMDQNLDPQSEQMHTPRGAAYQSIDCGHGFD